MEGKRGAVVALDPRNGEVLAMVSRPTFDPNKFTGRISRTDWNEIANDPYKPLLNRAIQAATCSRVRRSSRSWRWLDWKPASSTIRPSFICPGRRIFLRPLLRVPLEAAGTAGYRCIARSRNPATCTSITSANRLGIDRMAHYADFAGYRAQDGDRSAQ